MQLLMLMLMHMHTHMLSVLQDVVGVMRPVQQTAWCQHDLSSLSCSTGDNGAPNSGADPRPTNQGSVQQLTADPNKLVPWW